MVNVYSKHGKSLWYHRLGWDCSAVVPNRLQQGQRRGLGCYVPDSRPNCLGSLDWKENRAAVRQPAGTRPSAGITSPSCAAAHLRAPQGQVTPCKFQRVSFPS